MLVFVFVFLDYKLMFSLLQDLCAICTDFIISELWTSNFLAYQVKNALVYQTFNIILIYLVAETMPTCNFRYLQRIKITAYMENV